MACFNASAATKVPFRGALLWGTLEGRGIMVVVGTHLSHFCLLWFGLKLENCCSPSNVNQGIMSLCGKAFGPLNSAQPPSQREPLEPLRPHPHFLGLPHDSSPNFRMGSLSAFRGAQWLNIAAWAGGQEPPAFEGIAFVRLNPTRTRGASTKRLPPGALWRSLGATPKKCSF